MLKFFRVVRQKLLQKGHLSKYLIYASGEIFLVVIGILIALQVNNLNEERKRNSEEQFYLTELKKDFELNRTLLVEEIDYMNSRLSQIHRTLAYMYKPIPDSINLPKFLNYYYGTSIPPLEPVEGILEEILNSGKLQIIRNRQLRQDLSAWKLKIANVKEHLDKILYFREAVLRTYMLEKCPIDERFRDVQLKIFQDFQFQNLLMIFDKMINTHIHIKREPLQKLVDEILQLISQELQT